MCPHGCTGEEGGFAPGAFVNSLTTSPAILASTPAQGLKGRFLESRFKRGQWSPCAFLQRILWVQCPSIPCLGEWLSTKLNSNSLWGSILQILPNHKMFPQGSALFSKERSRIGRLEREFWMTLSTQKEGQTEPKIAKEVAALREVRAEPNKQI